MNAVWRCEECESINANENTVCKSCGASKNSELKNHYQQKKVQIDSLKSTINRSDFVIDNQEQSLAEMDTFKNSIQKGRRMDELLLKHDMRMKEARKKRNLDLFQKIDFKRIVFIIYGIIDYYMIYHVEFFDTVFPNWIMSILMIFGGALGGIVIMDELMKDWKLPYPINRIITACVGAFGSVFYEAVCWYFLVIIKDIF